MANDIHLTEINLICDYCNNYFWREKIAGDFTISGGSINVPSLQNGQYFRITGSVFNEGIHIYPASDLTDEEFKGVIWAMAIPKDIIALASDLHDWLGKYGSADSEALSPFDSESFGNYSYNKGSDSASDGSVSANSWQGAFASRLIPYRRLRGAR